LAENVRIRSYGGGVQNCSKKRHMIFERSLTHVRRNTIVHLQYVGTVCLYWK